MSIRNSSRREEPGGGAGAAQARKRRCDEEGEGPRAPEKFGSETTTSLGAEVKAESNRVDFNLED